MFYKIAVLGIYTTFIIFQVKAGFSDWANLKNGDATDVNINAEDQVQFKAMIEAGFAESIEKSASTQASFIKVYQKYLTHPDLDVSTISAKWYDQLVAYKISLDSITPRFIDAHEAFYNLDAIWDYGCWCVFGSTTNTLTAGGKTNDVVDEICKSLQLCYRCADLDSKGEGKGSCNAENISYSSSIGINLLGPLPFSITCHDPADSCEHRSCMCDSKFISDFITAAPTPEPMYKHPSFDFNASCTTVESHATRECCGSYPDRRPYNADPNSSMECCHEVTIYNTDYLTCCVDGSVVNLGGVCL